MDCSSVVVYIYYTCSFFLLFLNAMILLTHACSNCKWSTANSQPFALSPWHFGTRLEQPLQRRQALFYPLLLQKHTRARTLYCSLFLQTPETSVTLLLLSFFFFVSFFKKQTQRAFLCSQYVKDKATFSFTHNSTGGGGGGAVS